MAEGSSDIVLGSSDVALSPIVLLVGKQKRAAIKDLERYRGPLVDEVGQTLAEVRRELGAATNGKELVPVILIYREKSRRRPRRGLASLF